MLYGVGTTSIGTNALGASSLIGQNIVFPQCIASVQFTAESNNTVAQCWRDGVKIDVASRITSEMFNLVLTYEYIDFQTLGLLYGELPQDVIAALPTSKSVIVPSGLTVTESDINANNAASVRLYNETDAKFMTLAAATPGVNEYAIDAANGQITFNAAQEGATVFYKYDKQYTSIEAIGSGLIGNQFDSLSNLNFTGVVYSAASSEPYVLQIDRLERTETPSFTLAGDRAEVSITYKLIAPPGRRKPFTLYKLEGSTAV